MKGLIESFLEYIRPSFWQGDYNFLWLYLALIISLIIAYEKIHSYLDSKSIQDPVRTQQYKENMQKVWARQQEQLESLRRESPAESQEESKTNIEAEDPVPGKVAKKPSKASKPSEKSEKAEKSAESPENSEKSQQLERAKKKSEYFSGSSGPGGYRPNVKDRYPGVYKRGG
jgi:DNA mismatch repair ATPase MutL